MKHLTAVFTPDDHVFWELIIPKTQPLTSSHSTDVVIVGGGMAGLSAAQHFHNKGAKVTLLEQYYCGAGASGKSSGFITPDSEFDLSSLVENYGKDEAKKLWEFVLRGVEDIRHNIKKYSFECDYQPQDTLIVANTKATLKELREEYEVRKDLNYESTFYKDSHELKKLIATDQYAGGLSYSNTFGINSFKYCQLLKATLIEQGVKIHEESPVLRVLDNAVETPEATVKAKHIVLCTDRWTNKLIDLSYALYQIQTFLLLTPPLSDDQIRHMFPHDLYMTWDTDMLYQYYRIVGENRLLVGGGDYFTTYAREETHNYTSIRTKLSRYIKDKFPKLEDIRFDYQWPGLIGVTRDIIPLAGALRDQKSLYVIAAATGLPWAAALGRYSAECIIDGRSDLDIYFSPYRSFPLGKYASWFLGAPLTTAISHLIRVKSI